MAKLLAKGLSASAGKASLFRDVDLEIQSGELVVLLGPNGAGKTSVLRSILGLEKHVTGEVSLDDLDIRSLTPNERARHIAYLPQQRSLSWPNTVRDIVALGRFAYGAAPGHLGPVDQQAVNDAIGRCDLKTFADRRADTLSGGELARVHFARAFAAQTPLLIADEPVAALDPHHQFRIMDIVQTYVANGNSALIVLHDISLAAQYASRLIWMQNGSIISDGSVEETLTEARLATLYGIRAEVSGRSVQIKGTTSA